VTLPDSVDRYEEFRQRSSEASIDRQFTSVELVEAMLAAVRRLHGAGLMENVLSWDAVGEVAVDLRVEDDSTFRRVAVVPRSGAPASTRPPRLATSSWEPPSEGDAGPPDDLEARWSPDGDDLVQWETPIPPEEADSIMAKLGTVDGIHVYRIAESYLGQPVWAMDVLPPHPAPYRSQAKLNALKPTLFLSGRQHANEVSSTSHILRLAELLATDSTYRTWLRDVNVVLHPVANPDGARLAVEMQETNPDFMLHAGYLGALGVDMTAGERSDDPVYPESQARRRIREAWLPDIYINMHGYPSHEWVQYFAGYSAWVRSRRGGARDWWAPRGWFIPGYSWVDDEEHPEVREAQFAVLDAVAESITSLEEVEAMNRRMYARYRKYGTQDRDEFREHFHEGMLVYLRLRGAESIGTGVYSPRITYVAATTEAPDETARGHWLELVATAGIAHSTALLRYLAEGTVEVEREAEGFEGGVVERKVYRVKPVLPREDDEEEPAGEVR
jgi:hypothetical protein